jgi:NNP family nitrate/nitrite transporter-like MFS transporter
MYWAFTGSAICALLLAYPPVDNLLHGIHGPIRFTAATGVIRFVVLIFAFGLFMSFANGAVFKPIPVYYPGQCRRRRRYCRPDRRARRLRPAGDVRPAQ